MEPTSARPTRLRFAAAFVTSATATLLLLQLLRTGHAEEAPPIEEAPAVVAPVLARAELPPPGAQRHIAEPVDTVSPPPAPPVRKKVAHKKSFLKGLLPISDFGGY